MCFIQILFNRYFFLLSLTSNNRCNYFLSVKGVPSKIKFYINPLHKSSFVFVLACIDCNDFTILKDDSYRYNLFLVTSSGIVFGKQKLDVTFNSDKQYVMEFAIISKLTMCRASEAES